jgi:hypothetical protein
MTSGSGRAHGGTRFGGIALAAAIVVAVAAQAFVQHGFEERWHRRRFDNLLYLPSGRHVREMALGYGNFYADVLWMRAIGYYGDHALSDQEYPWLHHILDQVTSLDPSFRYPYYFGGVVLSVSKSDPTQSISILKKGMRQYPGDWRFPFYIGYNYFYELQDPASAAPYMKFAASLPGHPVYLPRLAASLLVASGRGEAAEQFLQTMLEGTTDETARYQIQKKIDDLHSGRVPDTLKAFLGGRRAP